MNSHANDAMIRRYEQELEERNTAVQAIIANAQGQNRDLNGPEQETLSGLRSRMGEIKAQLEQLESTADLARDVEGRLKQLDVVMMNGRKVNPKEIAYRSAGQWALDSYKAHLGDRQAQDRLELFHRQADHQKTPDNLGVIPDPVVGGVINFIDAARPIVSAIGPQPMPSATWHRPVVTGHTEVALQGTNGSGADEKSELVSQKMTITRLTANALTYGGYVNVSRQNIDFSSPQILDLIVNDLAAQYAIQTEAAVAAALADTATSAIGYGASPDADAVAAAIWEGVGQIYGAMKGQGRVILAIAPDVLGLFGPLFAPVNPGPSQSPGFNAVQFGQGVMGTIGGVPVVMSAGLDSGDAFLFSTAAIEVFEQRVGTLQVTEPSVLGVQIAYAGYFTPLTIEEDGIVPLTATS